MNECLIFFTWIESGSQLPIEMAEHSEDPNLSVASDESTDELHSLDFDIANYITLDKNGDFDIYHTI